jgi:aspartyl-tRNA synthetase
MAKAKNDAGVSDTDGIEEMGDWQRTHYSAEITPQMDGKTVILMGWARAIRGGAKIAFIQLADREGSIQITAKAGIVAPAVMEKIMKLNREDVLAVSGTVKSSKEAPNGLEIIPLEIRTLNRAEAPLPMEVVTKKTPAELPTRLDARFIDLRKPEVAAIFDITDKLKISFLNYFDQNGFININPPIIVGAATEGGTELFPVKYFDREAYLNQSPQLYKQILMAAGFDKVSIATPVFRAEPHDTYRHLNEMVQMDIEVAWVRDEEDVLKWFDGYLAYAIERVKKECARSLELLGISLSAPQKIKRLTYDEALEVLAGMKKPLKWGEDFSPEHERLLCEAYNPVLITKWPTAVRSFYSMPDPGNPKVCRAYDLLYNGLEISSGAQRIHKLDDLLAAFKRKDLDPSGFKFYIDAFRYGMPPHGGFSIGLERFVMALLKLSNIREASLFPRTRERLAP